MNSPLLALLVAPLLCLSQPAWTETGLLRREGLCTPYQGRRIGYSSTSHSRTFFSSRS